MNRKIDQDIDPVRAHLRRDLLVGHAVTSRQQSAYPLSCCVTSSARRTSE
jgi:hypothetical protein